VKAVFEPDRESEDFPLQRGVPLSPGEVVGGIGDSGRKIGKALAGLSDFPQEVCVRRRDGVEIRTTLVGLYVDASQADGTFYFSGGVRDDHTVNQNYLRGSEIESITFLEPSH